MNNILETPSQTQAVAEPVTERDGGVDAAVAAEAANKTLATQGGSALASVSPPELFEVDVGSIPEFLKRVA